MTHSPPTSSALLPPTLPVIDTENRDRNGGFVDLPHEPGSAAFSRMMAERLRQFLEYIAPDEARAKADRGGDRNSNDRAGAVQRDSAGLPDHLRRPIAADFANDDSRRRRRVTRSLHHLIMALEVRFGFKFRLAELQELNCVGDMIDIVAAKVTSNDRPPHTLVSGFFEHFRSNPDRPASALPTLLHLRPGHGGSAADFNCCRGTVRVRHVAVQPPDVHTYAAILAALASGRRTRRSPQQPPERAGAACTSRGTNALQSMPTRFATVAEHGRSRRCVRHNGGDSRRHPSSANDIAYLLFTSEAPERPKAPLHHPTGSVLPRFSTTASSVRRRRSISQMFD